MPTRSSLTVLWVTLVAMTFAAAPLAAETSSDPRKDLKSRDEDVRLEAMECLAVSGLQNASDLIAGRLRDKSPAVRLAAARGLGRVGDKKALSRLLAAVKPLKEDEATLVEICQALGEIGSPAAIDTLAGIGKREMSRREELTTSAVEALSMIRNRKSVEELIGLLGSATPTYSSRSYSYGHPQLVRPIRNALQKLTGERLGAHRVWTGWWRRVKKTFRFPEDPEAALKGAVFRDEGYQFKVERPSTSRWGFSRPKGILLDVTFKGPRDEASHAMLRVRAYSTRDYSPSTASELADRYADEFEDQFKDIKEKELDGSDRLSGKAAIFQRVLGMTNHGHVLVLRQWIAVYRGNLFTVRATLSTGADEKVRKELEKIIRSFKFL